jgi:guanylate kinase
LNNLGILYILAAPSGAGKTSLVKGLLASIDGVEVSVSYTTRQPRPGDVNGKDYHFLTPDEFSNMMKNSDFLEYATVFGNQYGTSRQWVVDKLEQGIDIILEIDWQGARQIRQIFTDALSIYIIPPSIEVLKQRLVARDQDDEAVVRSRMQQAKSEMSHAHEFDYMVINDDYAAALHDLGAILQANRLRMGRQLHNHEKLLAELAQNS